ncbi:RNA 2',3'-cyclic phosphodiesterase [ANME-1 cluster archaeon ex4572_4]|nr:MAG: RNA 2',3'-cyclic phosphodiesterase [ANME-1 cluster archaeon ex4572_4]
MRAFVAVDLSKEIRAKLKVVQRQFADFGTVQGQERVGQEQGQAQLRQKLKFVNPWQTHQTVKFLGEVPAERVVDVKVALAGVSQSPFEVALRGVGFFPVPPLKTKTGKAKARVKTVRVVWVGIEEGAEELRALQEEVESQLQAAGVDFPPERRGPFSAHVTLCRVKKPLSKEKTKTEKIEEKKARAHIFSVYDVTKYIKQRLDEDATLSDISVKDFQCQSANFGSFVLFGLVGVAAAAERV